MAQTLSFTSDRQQHLFESLTPVVPMPWEQAAAEDRLTARVVVNRPLYEAYSYLVPEHLRGDLRPGQRVRVPFGKGNRLVTGYCVEIGPVSETSAALKSVHSLVDREPLASPDMLELTRWIADYYLCGWGQVLDGVIPQSVKRRAGTRIVKRYRLADRSKDNSIKLSPKQQAVLQVLEKADGPLKLEELAERALCGKGPIEALAGKGLIEAVRERSAEFAPELSPIARHEDLKLNAHQQRAVDAIKHSLQEQEHRTFLLHGVTGSGKTEVYIQAIREVASYGRQAIVLVPEISITPQTIERFRSRFDSVAVLHSHLSDAERYWHWRQIREGKVQVIVGARSAVFAPTPSLGLIIIDEEHETSFKQDATPRYHAREVARQRAKRENVPLVLGSATPTLESWQRAISKKDVLLSLPNRVESRDAAGDRCGHSARSAAFPRPGHRADFAVGDEADARRRRAGDFVFEPAGLLADDLVPILRGLGEVSALRCHVDLASGPQSLPLPRLRLSNPRRQVPGMRAGHDPLPGQRHAAARAGSPLEVSRLPRAADGQRFHAEVRKL